MAYAATTTGTANLYDSYFNKTRVTNGNVASGAVINYYWTTIFRTIDGKTGLPISGENVTYSSGAASFYDTTNATGYTGSHVVLEQKLVNSTKTYNYMPATIGASKTGSNYATYSGTATIDDVGIVNVLTISYPAISSYTDVFVDNIVGILFVLLVLAVVFIFAAYILGAFKDVG
jgi:hypothetical protein